MRRHDEVRDVFRDPDIGDEIKVDGELYRVERIERHAGKRYIVVRVGRQATLRQITYESWREYRDDEDVEVMRNTSIVDVF